MLILFVDYLFIFYGYFFCFFGWFFTAPQVSFLHVLHILRVIFALRSFIPVIVMLPLHF